MKLIDSHCHLQFDSYAQDRERVIDECREQAVGLVVVGCDYDGSKEAVELTRGRKNIWAAVGQHPTEYRVFDAEAFSSLANEEKVVAIGECGLDYYRLTDETREEKIQFQKELFGRHLELARETGKPLIIHSRDAHEDLTEMLEAFCQSFPSYRRGVLHCFTGTADDAHRYLDLGFSISFTGIITFANQYDDVVSSVPMDKILIETDAPLLTPVPHRGKRNHPAYVEYIARRIAELKGISFDDVARHTTENAQRLFRLL